MKSIWKFPVPTELRRKHIIKMPVNAVCKFAMVDIKINQLCMWWEFQISEDGDGNGDGKVKTEDRCFLIYGTGHEISDSHEYIFSWQEPPFIWHLYEVLQ